MDFRELFLIQHARLHAVSTANADLSAQDNALRGASDAQIRARPQTGFNSMAWLLWHITRGEDIGANLVVAEQSQVFDDGWPGKLGVSRRDFGPGMTDDEVDEFNEAINIDALLAYRDAVGRQTQQIIQSLDAAELEKPIRTELVDRARADGAVSPGGAWVLDRWADKNKTYALGHTILGHSFIHLGQMDINRGLLGLPTV